MIFLNPSTRTRNSFVSGIFQLGATVIFVSRVPQGFQV
ncbi:MAG: hypothetical protein JSV25_10460 [Spirochaetota bacterium]|nr:MAG: hypothetical protein JSV25_10460 [Spirochaetota bacterium]